jgi:hypothetical protein
MPLVYKEILYNLEYSQLDIVSETSFTATCKESNVSYVAILIAYTLIDSVLTSSLLDNTAYTSNSLRPGSVKSILKLVALFKCVYSS